MQLTREIQLHRQHSTLQMSLVLDAALQRLFLTEAKDQPSLSSFLDNSDTASTGSCNSKTHHQQRSQPGGLLRVTSEKKRAWEHLEHEMEDIQQMVQEMNTRMGRLQCNMYLLKQVALTCHDENSGVVEEAPPPPPKGSLQVGQSISRASEFDLYETPLSALQLPTTQETATTQEQEPTATTQEQESTATRKGLETVSAPTKQIEVVKEQEPKKSEVIEPRPPTIQHVTRVPPFLASRSAKILPTSPTIDINQSFVSLTTGPGIVSVSENQSIPPTTENLKDRSRSRSPPGTTRRLSARRISLEHGLQNSGRENYIRHIQLDRLIRPAPLVSRSSSFVRRVTQVFDGPPNLGDSGAKFHRFCFHHESKRRLVWDFCLMVMIITDVIVTPLALSFGLDNPVIRFIDSINNAFYVVDFLIRFLTSYTQDRGAELISDPKKTAWHYLSTRWIVFDLMSCFPWETFMASRSIGRLLGIAKCVRLVQLPKLTRRMLPLRMSGILAIIELFGIVFMVSHFNSCCWNLIALDWRHEFAGYETQSVFWRYALCWSTVIGAINASPPIMHNPTEEITVALYMIMGNVIQATVFGSVAHLISSFNEQEDAYQKKLMLTHDRCRFLGIPDSLSNRIQSYYRSLYRETKSVCADADSFINELSPALVCDVKYNLYRDMLKQIPFLASQRIDNSVVELLVMHLTTVLFTKDDVVARRGERADWMGFIGVKGSVAVLEYVKQTHRIRRVLRKGDYFGEMAVFHAGKRENTIVARSWVQIHQLFRKDFESVKENYPDQGTILEEEMSKYMSSKAANKL